MRKILQIEELRYGRRESYDEAALNEMIECFKNEYEDELPQASLSPFYPLIERTIYQFDEGKLTGSERTFYLLGRQIRSQKFVEWYPDWNREAPTVYYDAKRDEYVVRHIRYDVDKNTPRFISQAMAEADYPRRSKDIQAPPETRATAPQPAPQSRPVPQPAPQPVVTITEQPKKKKWKRIDELKCAYESGKTLQQIVDQFECTPEGAIYQLKTYLNIKHPFEQKPKDAPKETILGVDKSKLTPEQVEVGKGIERFKSFLVKWPKSKTKRLKAMYLDGCSAKEMMQELQCEKDELTFRLIFEVGAKNPFEECNKKPWDKEQDELLLYYYVLKNGDIPGIATLLRRSELGINKRLYDLIGRVYNGMPKETSRQSAQAGIRRYEWKIKREEIKEQIEADIRKIQEQERRKAEDEAKKVNGFYRPGVQVNHPIWGFITVIKDDEHVLKYVTLDGIRRTVRK